MELAGPRAFPACPGSARGQGLPPPALRPHVTLQYFPLLHCAFAPPPHMPVPDELVLIRPDTAWPPSRLGGFLPRGASQSKGGPCGPSSRGSITTLAVLGGCRPGPRCLSQWRGCVPSPTHLLVAHTEEMVSKPRGPNADASSVGSREAVRRAGPWAGMWTVWTRFTCRSTRNP